MAVSWWYRIRWELTAYWRNLHNKRMFSLLVGTASWSLLWVLDHFVQTFFRGSWHISPAMHLDHILFGLVIGWAHGQLQKRRFEREMYEKWRFLFRTGAFSEIAQAELFVEEMLKRRDLNYLDNEVERLLFHVKRKI